MKVRAVRSILSCLAAIILFTGGVTTAWFIDTAAAEPAAMVTGTVKLNVLPAQVKPQPQDQQLITWQPGTSKTFCWLLQNTGSKKIMLRVRPVIEGQKKDETAWAEGKPFNPCQGNWAMYSTYTVGSGKKSTRLLAGQNDHCGDLIVQTKNKALHVTYRLKQGYELLESHLAVANKLADIPTVANGNPPPGQFPFKTEHQHPVREYTYIIPLSGTYPAGHLKGRSYNWPDGQKLYLAAHADVSVPGAGGMNDISWQLASESPAGWKKGAPEKIDGKTVTWWYYRQPIAAGDDIKFCLTGCLGQKAARGTYKIQLQAEAVQASHAAVDIWPHPWK